MNSLISGFLESSERFPQRAAIDVGGTELSYADLRAKAEQISAVLASSDTAPQKPLTAIFAQRSETAFAGIIAALLRGHGYVPLNPNFPADRTATMLERSEATAVVVDEFGKEKMEAVISEISRSITVLLPQEPDVSSYREQFPNHKFLGQADLQSSSTFTPVDSKADGIAYLMFTSGSTGVPKGVMVSHSNVKYFLKTVIERYTITETDRLSHMFDLVFDLSVFDLFAAWECGACVCSPSPDQLLTPAGFMNDARLTIWFSVPSLALFMRRLGLLEQGAFPQLRWSLFCGEALTLETAGDWATAAPSSIVENLYGPTELTLSCTLHRWDEQESVRLSEHGVVPIGEPFPGMTPLVVDEQLHEVAPGEDGELLMAGPQVALGYWNDKAATERAFLIPPGQSEIFYRTGDRVRRPAEGTSMNYLGRIDHQIKIRGNRVELGEVEAVLRELTGIGTVAVIGWPVTPSGADGLIAFLETEEADVPGLRREIGQRLPDYMRPKQLRLLSTMPLNANGKIDRGALRKLCEENPSGRVPAAKNPASGK